MASMWDNFNPTSLVTAPITGVFDYAGGKAQADAAKYAADQQSAAANHAADVQSQSAANTLAFQRQQAHQDFLNAQAAQLGNYNQWRAREGRLSQLGQSVGLQPFQIPDYVPLTEATDPTPAQSAPPNGYQLPMSAAMRYPNVPGIQY